MLKNLAKLDQTEMDKSECRFGGGRGGIRHHTGRGVVPHGCVQDAVVSGLDMDGEYRGRKGNVS